MTMIDQHRACANDAVFIERLLAALAKMDEAGLIILLAGAKGLANGNLDISEFETKTTALFDRHRSGAGVTLDEIAALEGGAK